MKLSPNANTRNSSTEGEYVDMLLTPTFEIVLANEAKVLFALGSARLLATELTLGGISASKNKLSSGLETRR